VINNYLLPHSLFPIPYSLFPIPYSLFPIPYSLFPIPQKTAVSQPENLKSLLESVANGTISPDTAFESLKDLAYESVGEFAKIDHHRHLRTGFPEVIWGPGKTPEQIAQIMEVMRHRTSVVMATRIQPDVYSILQKKVRGLQYFELARICAIIPHEIQPRFPGEIGIVSAGTADLPVAEEAAITAQLYGFRVQRLWDVGVAGIHRLLNNRHLLNSASVLIVVAGMEGALPSVVAGLADCPVIAVPTSIGYGASFGGLAPLLTMLNSCAAGIGVVNIDNGFGAAVLAGQILRTSEKLRLASDKELG
jgi:NCAIR mutase (PurE)-related protein